MADPLAVLVSGPPITAEVLRDYGNLLLRAADKSIIGGTGCCIQRQEIPEY